jgi:hypothetical protein
MIGFAGLIMIWPVAAATNTLATSLVIRYPIYTYVPAVLFWTAADLLGPLLSGILVAYVAPRAKVRPMSAALAMVATLGVWWAVAHVVGWLYGLPGGADRITRSVVHWLRVVVNFGGMMLIGTAIGRLMAVRDRSRRLRPSAQ